MNTPQTTHHCECEHHEHFEDSDENSDFVPPTCHAYGAADQAVAAKTPYGTFKICKYCAENHYQDYPQEVLR